MRALCTADIHIGRSSTKLPENADVAKFTGAAAWERIVNLALSQDVDCVVLAGDIIDRDSSRFEALGAMEQGLSLLNDAAIPVFAVTGNHDHDTLQKVAEHLKQTNFELLGADGDWECVDDFNGVRIAGKSYAKTGDIFNNFPPADIHKPTLAILHSSLSAGTDAYMPVSPKELAGIPNTKWIIGHIHQQQPELETDNIIVPGSPQALSPIETGLHGVVVLTIDEIGTFSVQRTPLSSIRYERLEVSVEGAETEFEISDRFQQAVQEIMEKEQLHSLRVSFTGRTQLHNEIQMIAQEITKPDVLERFGSEVHIDNFEVLAAPPIDLHTLATGNDMLAKLAELILSIDSGAGNRHLEYISESARKAVHEGFSQNVYSPISYNITQEAEDLLPDNEMLKYLIRSRAYALLSEFISQKERS